MLINERETKQKTMTYPIQQLKGHGCYFPCMSPHIWLWKAWDNHIRIANSFNFVYIIAFNDVVEECIQVIQETHHLLHN